MKKFLVTVLMTTILPASGFAADPEKAQIVTYKANVAKCVAAVHINQIDGKGRQLPAMGFEIEPGEHTMKGLTKVDLINCEPSKSHSRKSASVPPLDWSFEPGKTYYIGLDYMAPLRENWRFVVWKVFDEYGEEVFDTTRRESTQ